MRSRRRRAESLAEPWTAVPAVSGPGSLDQAADGDDGDDGVGEVEGGVDHQGAAFVAAGQAVEGVPPGMGALDVPASACLDRCLLVLVGDPSVQSSPVQFRAGAGRVVTGIEVHGDAVRQRFKPVQQVESWGQGRGVVAVGASDGLQGSVSSESSPRCQRRRPGDLLVVIDRP